MPKVRRSNRVKSKKEPNDNKSSPCPSPAKLNVKSKLKEEQKTESDPGLCFACKQKHPPVRRFKVVEWAQCDNCDQWWHAECACITAEDCVKFAFYDISFTCALCCLKGSPWIAKNHKITDINPVDTDSKESCEESDRKKVQKKKAVKQEKVLVKENSERGEKAGNIIVIDNIGDAQHWKSSKTITERLKQVPELKNTEFAYSLPRGGIALHYKTEEEAASVLNSWPEKVFDEQEKPHFPKENTESSVGYLKNIDIKISDQQLKDFLESKDCQVQQVKRVFHRNSGKPMPIRKVEFSRGKDLVKACNLVLPYLLNGKQAFCERENGVKVVRCFNCHRFNHIVAHCPNRTTCENCGSEDHSDSSGCQLQSKCTNCQGNHKSSSKLCPKYIELLEKIRKRNIC